MIEHSLLLKLTSPGLIDGTTSQLRQEYLAYQKLFQTQPDVVQKYLNTQAGMIADALMKGLPQIHFTLPNQVDCEPQLDPSGMNGSVPGDVREQNVGGVMTRLTNTDLCTVLGQRFSQLEQSECQAVSISAGLLRYAVGIYLIYQVLPVGRSVVYTSPDEDDIPNQPVEKDLINETVTANQRESDRHEVQANKRSVELMTPYVKAAQRFYLPQWVAFDGKGNLLIGSIDEAEACIASMQQYLHVLNIAIVIAPFMIADEMCQQKRYGMLGQLVNQGRALAHFQVMEIVRTIKRRAAVHNLDRGLSLSLPYFNDQTLLLEEYNFEIIPAGRVMFIPAFVVLAVQAQGVKVAQDTRLSPSTRRQLLRELSILENTFLR
jgi:hypothetical protein